MTEIQRLDASHHTAYLALTQEVLGCLPNPDWFMPLSDELLKTMFLPESTFVVHGCFVDGELAGVSLYDTCYEEIEEVAKAAGAPLTKKGAELGISMVLPKFRGQNMMYKLNSSLVEAAKEKGFDYLLATAHPDNLPSNASIRKLGMEYKKTIIRQGHYERNVYFMAL
ncbi:MAG: GNAT family N-acetyltransferase [Clostridia bacterium]|nr:GNAT family N-acetyltransferase [Clostridia bacterium]